MTAPMVVTNWINLQYHASTVDNRRYGSGNKVLHNVVGGRLGVFEGNGGDLRIGLPLQSLHDGQVAGATRRCACRCSSKRRARPSTPSSRGTPWCATSSTTAGCTCCASIPDSLGSNSGVQVGG